MPDDKRGARGIDSTTIIVAAGAGAIGAWLWFRNRPQQPTYPSSNIMNGRVCVVTGANTGIGKAAAKALASQGAHVILGCRSTSKGDAACDDIRKAVPGAEVQTLHLDLESFDSVRAFVKGFRDTGLPLHVLVNNAGLMVKKPENVLGMEKTLVINQLGPFLLTNLLLPDLQKSAKSETAASRIVNVSSKLEKNGNLPAMEKGVPPGTDWFHPPPDEHEMWKQYGTSKLCNLLSTFELDRRLAALNGGSSGRAGGESMSVTVNAVTPGVVNSDLGRNILGQWIFWAVKPILGLVMRSVDKGAETVVWAASSPEIEGSSGKFFGDLKETACSDKSKDEELAGKLWEACEVAAGLDEKERVV